MISYILADWALSQLSLIDKYMLFDTPPSFGIYYKLVPITKKINICGASDKL